jgi:hypothetical protein
MAIYDSKINLAVEKLGRYFNIVSKEKFMAFLAFGDEDAIDSFGNVNFDPTPEIQKLARLFTDSTEGGGTMKDAYDSVAEIIGTCEADEKEALEKIGFKTYSFLGEPAGLDNDWADTWPGKFIRLPHSVKYLCNIPDEDEGQINSSFSEPSKYSPNLVSILIRPVKMTPATRESGAVGLFMNSIPTLEFSRCQPMLDITLISPFAALSGDNRIQSMGQMQFLMGQAQLEPPPGDGSFGPENINAIIASAVDESALGDYVERLEAEIAALKAEGMSDEDAKAAAMEELGGVATSGMEMFTSPQTLVPWNELYDDYEAYQDATSTTTDTTTTDGETTTTETSHDASAGGKRGAAVIDRSRPFMTIDGFNVTVTPSKGMMSHKSAELSLLLHDRSRLSEIAEFVKPDLYGRTELMIEYGWSHPQDNAYISGDDIGGNFYGTFLNALKCKEKYMIVNSSFSFDEVGQVKVKLKLAMKGSQQIDTTNISKGEGVDDILETIKDLIDAIKKLKQEMMKDATDTGGDAADITGATHISAASSTSSALSIDEETQKSIASYISKNSSSDDANTQSMTNNLTSLFGSDGTGGAAADAQKSIDAAVAEKLAYMKKRVKLGHDPYRRTFRGAGGSTTYVNIPFRRKDYVSLGYLLLYFVGKPLAATRRFDEVQFVYYAYNDKASYLKDANIAETPIKIVDFEKKFKENTKTGANLPLSRFLGMLSSEFIHAQTAPIYGLTKLYTTDEEGNAELKESLKEDATALNNEKKKRLEDAFGESEDVVFKMPRIGMQLETVPVKTGSTLPTGTSGTICRVHIYDKSATTYSALGKLMEATRSDKLGVITSAASAASEEAQDIEEEEGEYNVNSEHAEEFIDILQDAIEGGLLEAIPELMGVTVEGDDVTVDPEQFGQNYFRIKGGFSVLKSFVAKTMPSIIYGSNLSAVISADLASMNNSKLATVNMLRGGMGGGSTAQGARDSGLPLQTAPTSLSLTTWGCPIVNYGQNFFVDFGTGTTADNQYVVTGIDHSIEPGKFETKIKLAQVDAFGKFSSMFQSVQTALVAIASTDEDAED